MTPDRPLPPAAAPQVARFVGLASGTEGQLHDALLLVAERHDSDYEIRQIASVIAGWSTLHRKWLEPTARRYGDIPSERPEKLRARIW